MLPRSYRLLLHFFLLLSTIAHSHNTTTNQKLIFILAGQSNMSGRGGVSGNMWDGVVPPESRPSPSALRLDARLLWEQAAEPLHADIDVTKPCGVGPGLPFANAVLESGAEGEEAVVGLVPCAIGGTRISEWAQGRRLYVEMVRRTRATVSNSSGRIGALLWYQGESDTVWRADAEAYKGRMETFVKNLRADLEEPELLVIQVALASGEGPFVETVRQAQIGINMSNVVCVDANGLPLESDRLHLTTQAQVQLGKMLADAYLNRELMHSLSSPSLLSITRRRRRTTTNRHRRCYRSSSMTITAVVITIGHPSLPPPSVVHRRHHYHHLLSSPLSPSPTARHYHHL